MKQKQKVQVFHAGIYQPVQVVGKYGKRLELPNQYTVVVIPNDCRRVKEPVKESENNMDSKIEVTTNLTELKKLLELGVDQIEQLSQTLKSIREFQIEANVAKTTH